MIAGQEDVGENHESQRVVGIQCRRKEQVSYKVLTKNSNFDVVVGQFFVKHVFWWSKPKRLPSGGVVVSTQFLPPYLERFLMDVSRGALREVGTDREALLRLIRRKKELGNDIASVIRALSSPYGIASLMLGPDFISPEEVMLALNIVYADTQFSWFDKTAPKLAVAEWCRDNGNIIVPGPNTPLSLRQIQALKPKHFSPFFYGRNWSHEGPPFAHNDRVGVGWFALSKEPILGSAFSGWDHQVSLVPSIVRVPNVAEVAWYFMLCQAVRGIRLSPNGFVRTSSKDTRGTSVSLGRDDSNGGALGVGPWSDDHRSERVGLITVRDIP